MVGGIFICNNFTVPDGISVPYIPLEVLFGNLTEERDALSLSPDGTKLAYRAPVNGVYNLWLKTLDTDDDRPITSSSKESVDYRYFWLTDGVTLVYSRYDDAINGHCIYMVNTATGEEKNLTPFKYTNAHIIGAYNPLPYTILISRNTSDEPDIDDIYSLNIVSGELKLIEKGSHDENIAMWFVDARGTIRGKIIDTDNSTEIWVKDSGTVSWKKLLDFDLGKDGDTAYIRLSSDGKDLYLYLPDPRFSNTNELVKVNLMKVTVWISPRINLHGMTMLKNSWLSI